MKVFWNNPEKTILIREYPSDWDWNDFHLGISEMRQLLQEVQHDVYIIIDCRRMKQPPIGALAHFSDGNRNLPENVRLRILVSSHKRQQAFLTILKKVVPQNFENFYVVATMDAALAKIAESQQF